jgi:hypothetical protein
MVYSPMAVALFRVPRVANAWTEVLDWRVTEPLPTKLADRVAAASLGAVPSVV